MAIAVQELYRPVAVHQRDYTFTDPNVIKRICISELGNIEPEREDKIHNRCLAIGISDDGKIILAYPKGSERLQGFHAETSNLIADLLGFKLIVMLHGSISPQVEESKLLHVISIYKSDPDSARVSGIQDIVREIPRHKVALEIGKLFPENYVGPWEAQQLMRNLGAHRLEIVESRYSKPLYNPKNIRQLLVYRPSIPAEKYKDRLGD